MGGEEDEQMVTEEFTVWKKNTPFLYDLVISHALEWPSLTVQWLPTPPSPPQQQDDDDISFAVHKLILGTHTSDGVPNYLMIAEALLPISSDSYDTNTSSDNISIPRVQVTQQILVDGEVNRARWMPQNADLIAAKTSGAEVYVFNSSKKQDEKPSSCEPDFRLRGHVKEGYGLSWSPFKEGYLLSGSNDSKICLWDISATASSDRVLDAMNIYEVHDDIVEDVAWHLKNENLFGSVGDDHRLMIWDLRSSTSGKPQESVVAHAKEKSGYFKWSENLANFAAITHLVGLITIMAATVFHYSWFLPYMVNSLSFNPFNEWILATASSDMTVNLFDLRKLTSALHSFSGHTEEVFQVEWSPKHETVLATSAADRRLMIWDLSRIGDEQSEEDAEDGPPELLFSHGGHTAKISDFSWNQNEPWVISSVAEDNILQVWQMAESIYQ